MLVRQDITLSPISMERHFSSGSPRGVAKRGSQYPQRGCDASRRARRCLTRAWKKWFLQPNQHFRRETDRLLKKPEPIGAGSADGSELRFHLCCTTDVQDTVIGLYWQVSKGYGFGLSTCPGLMTYGANSPSHSPQPLVWKN